ncbi:MAG: hypothetical protein N3D12_01870 [Candidatus Methanomethyliaceae archaeon]|nr:hypothetical protein [Candidatus Methanomethyliaceae archaeon]
MVLYAVEFDGRGVTQTALLRAAAEIICNAADKDGNPSLGYERYDDAPDRVGIPIKGFAIVSKPSEQQFWADADDVEAELSQLGAPVCDMTYYKMCYDELAPEAMLYEPAEVNAVLVLDDTLVKGGEPWAHIGLQPIHEKLKDGGAIIVNSKRSPDELLNFIQPTNKKYKLVTIDASGMDKIIIVPLLGAMLKVAPGIVSYRAMVAAVKERYIAEGMKKAEVLREAYKIAKAKEV